MTRRSRRVALAIGACVGCVAATASGAEPRVIVDPLVGYRLERPADWQVGRATIGTAFAVGARCRSAVVVDAEPPPDSGGAGPGVQRSAVQVCARRATDGDGLAAYLRRQYGPRLAESFKPVRFGGHAAFATGSGGGRMVFLQRAPWRIQVVTTVNAEPPLRERRLAETARALNSFEFMP